jgi:(p)ppGpp synthase/HD superfamily hydrolase
LYFIDEFPEQFFRYEIYVFTPKGDLKVLPQHKHFRFCFDIHSEIGEGWESKSQTCSPTMSFQMATK